MASRSRRRQLHEPGNRLLNPLCQGQTELGCHSGQTYLHPLLQSYPQGPSLLQEGKSNLIVRLRCLCSGDSHYFIQCYCSSDHLRRGVGSLQDLPLLLQKPRKLCDIS